MIIIDGKQLEYNSYDTSEISNRLELFLAWFEKEIYGGEPQKLMYCRIVYHYLSHVAHGIAINGPASIYWQYPLEKVIGRISPWIKSRRYPYVNFAKILRMMSKLALLPFIYEGFQYEKNKEENKHLFLGLHENSMELLHPKRIVTISPTEQNLLLGYYKGLFSETSIRLGRNTYVQIS